MSAPGPVEVQARIRLSALLFRTAMPRLAKALSEAGEAPPRAEEKGSLLKRLEESAWALGPEAIAGADEAGWEEDVLALAPVAETLRAAVEDVVRARRA